MLAQSAPNQIVLVVGSLHYDLMVEADHLPRKDETAVGSRWYPKFGGKGGNQAASCVLQGGQARMVGAVGQDEFGRFMLDHLQTAKVDHRLVAEIPGAGSGMSVAIMDASGDYAATIVSGANLLIAPDLMQDSTVWDGIDLLVLQNEIPETVNLAAATEARRRGIPTLLNAAPYREMSPAFTAMIDILVVNSVEAEMMGTNPVISLQTAADAARQLAPAFDCVIVTAGAQGLAVQTAKGENFHLAAEKVKAISSHGAGDAFIGALAAALVRKTALKDACQIASLAAARHVAGLTPEKH